MMTAEKLDRIADFDLFVLDVDTLSATHGAVGADALDNAVSSSCAGGNGLGLGRGDSGPTAQQIPRRQLTDDRPLKETSRCHLWSISRSAAKQQDSVRVSSAETTAPKFK